MNYGGIYAVNKVIYAYRQVDGSVFSSMKMLEKAVLNVQGMDVDLRYAPRKLKKYVVKRYARDVVYMYIWRKKVTEILGSYKRDRYIAGCSSLNPSCCSSVLTSNKITNDNSFIFEIVKRSFKYETVYAIKQYLRYCFRRFLI